MVAADGRGARVSSFTALGTPFALHAWASALSDNVVVELSTPVAPELAPLNLERKVWLHTLTEAVRNETSEKPWR
jgi:hypothetical protein